mmetsp:Transcript_48267/g.103501  ORF Transcript_48267/g.103501 Transcript_48267/m.103501 type:complete len:219 (-) Transcript_48267:156-812(-)
MGGGGNGSDLDTAEGSSDEDGDNEEEEGKADGEDGKAKAEVEVEDDENEEFLVQKERRLLLSSTPTEMKDDNGEEEVRHGGEVPRLFRLSLGREQGGRELCEMYDALVSPYAVPTPSRSRIAVSDVGATIAVETIAGQEATVRELAQAADGLAGALSEAVEELRAERVRHWAAWLWGDDDPGPEVPRQRLQQRQHRLAEWEQRASTERSRLEGISCYW